MNPFKEQYRQFNLNFSENRRVYFDNFIPVVETAKDAVKKSADHTKQLAKVKDFSHHQKRFDEHMKKLPSNIGKPHVEKFNKDFAALKKRYDELVKAKHPANVAALKVHADVDSLLVRVRKHHAPEKTSNKPSENKEKLSNKKFDKLTETLAKTFGLTSYSDKLYLKEEIIPKLGLTKEQEKALMMGNLDLSKEQMKKAKAALPTYLKQPSPREFKLIQVFTRNHKVLSKFFGDFKAPAFQLLSQKYDFSLKKGKLIIKQRGKEVPGSPATKPEDLLKFFEPKIKAQFDLVMKGGDKLKDNEITLAKMMKKQVSNNKVFLKFKETFLSPDSKDVKGGFISKIMMFVALYKRAMAAFQRGDVSELKDYLDAWNASGNSPRRLSEMVDGAKNIYRKNLDRQVPPPSMKLLLKAYLNPSKKGKSANKLFTFSEKGSKTNKKLMRFRSQAKVAIQEYIIANLKVAPHNISNVTGIKRLPSGYIEITGYRNNMKVGIEINPDAKSLQNVPIRAYKTINKKEQKANTIGTLNLDNFGNKSATKKPSQKVATSKKVVTPKRPKLRTRPMLYKPEDINRMNMQQLEKAATLVSVQNPILKNMPEYKEIRRIDLMLNNDQMGNARTAVEEQLLSVYKAFLLKYSTKK